MRASGSHSKTHPILCLLAGNCIVEEKHTQGRDTTADTEVAVRSVLTMVVSAMDPKLLMKMLQLTFTGGPANQERIPTES